MRCAPPSVPTSCSPRTRRPVGGRTRLAPRWRDRALAVVRPGSTAEVAAVVRACAAHDLTLVATGWQHRPWAAAVPTTAAGTQVLLSLQRLNCVRAIDRANLAITVGSRLRCCRRCRGGRLHKA